MLPSHARFCNECGTTITPPLGSAPVAGTALESARASAVAPSPTTERRLCSVLFVDLVGFTPLAEKRDPEEIRELLTLYFERAEAIIGHYGGHGREVHRRRGHGGLGSTGRERGRRRAGRPRGPRRGGLGGGARESSPAWSSQPEPASSPERSRSRSARCPRAWCSATPSTPPPGSKASPRRAAVLVDESTWRAASGAIAFAEVGELHLKGKEEAVQAWRAASRRRPAQGPRTL